jgi:hypothetical protein
MVPVGHAHTPDTQAAPTGQACPQEPQLLVSVDTLTHPVVPQATSPALHTHAVTAGVPVVMHDEPGPHTRPQTPQLKLSVVRLTQLETPPETQVFGAVLGQPQTPEVHVPPSEHA